MRPLSEKQDRQESQYEFPYHYIPHLRKGRFSQVRVLRWGYEYLSCLRFVLDRIESRPAGSLLDVGCGDGRLLHEARERFGEIRLLGVDTSQRAVGLARGFNPDVEFLVGDVTRSDLTDEEFDVVTLIDTLEHIDPGETAAFLAGIGRRVRDGGRVIVTVPSTNVRVRGKHYRHFDLESLTETLSPCFAVCESFHLNRKSWRVRVLHRMLTNGLFILNSTRLVNWIFRHYQRRFLIAGAGDCGRICVIARKNPDA